MFGAASATAGAGVGLGPRLRYDERAIVNLVDEFATDGSRSFPTARLWNARGADRLDVTTSHQPFFGTYPGGALHVGAGYTGGGVGPCHMGGKILSGLVTGVEDEWTSLPITTEPKRFPPEPFRSARRRDRVQDAIRPPRRGPRPPAARPDLVTDLLARLPRKMGYELGP